MAKRGVKVGQKRGPYKKKEKAEIIETAQLLRQEFNESEQAPDHSGIQNIPESNIDNTINSIDNTVNSIPDPITPPPVKNEFEEKEGESLLNDFINENKAQGEFIPNSESDQIKQSQAISQPQRPQSQQMLISGYMLLSLCDFIAPNLLLRLFKYMSPLEYEGIKASSIKLTSEQKLQLKESADEVAKMIFSEVSPLTVFFVGLAGFYYSNLQEQKDIMTEKKKALKEFNEVVNVQPEIKKGRKK